MVTILYGEMPMTSRKLRRCAGSSDDPVDGREVARAIEVRHGTPAREAGKRYA
jgi:hypothetical protein